jgi:hypothetical protein
MAVLTTKFSMGETVFHAWTTTTRKRHPCPDCLDQRKWKATSPAGREYEMACPRCGSDYMSDRDLSLDYSQFVGTVTVLTIGQIRAAIGGDEKTQYMCVETGIGSGSLYYEDSLFPTQEAAQVAADQLAALSNSQVNWVVEQYNKTLRVCDYQLSDASVQSTKDELKRRISSLSYIIGDLRDCISMAEVQRQIDKFDEAKKAA